jgi:UDP-GlcNAc:undecaprenyl-phosphate GlcNAc-1-phosphate transferase
VITVISLVLPGLVAAALAFALTPFTARLALLVGAIDQPGWRKTHAVPIPRLGGLAVVSASAAAWTAAQLLGVSLPRELWIGLVAGGLPILAVSVMDDVKGVSAGRKLLVQMTGASLAVASGVSLGEVVHLFDVAIVLGVWAAPLSVVWLVGVTNAFNLIDGLDGLSAGLALIAALCMAAVFGLVGQPIMAGTALVLAGALAGFLPFNLHPARLFLGDTGATWIGFCLAAFALKGGSTLSSGFAALVPVLIMGLPIADTLIAMARRTIRGLEHRRGGVFVADHNHIHHRLLALGIDHGRAVLILYGAGLVCAVGAFASLFLQARHAALFIVGVLVAGAVGVRRLGYDEFAFIRRGTMLRAYKPAVVNTAMFVVFADLAMSAVASYLAIGLRLDAWSLRGTIEALVDLVVVVAPLTVAAFWYTGVYRGTWRVADVTDLARVSGAAIMVAAAGAIVHPLLSAVSQATSLFVIYGLVSVVLVTSSRAAYVVLRTSQRRASHQGVPVLLYGAGRHGAAAAQELLENPGSGLRPIGFVDDDPGTTGQLLSGLPVLGRSYELGPLVTAHRAKAVVLASSLVSPECQERIADACGRAGIGLFRMRVQLEPLLAAAETADAPEAVSTLPVAADDAAAVATTVADGLRLPFFESEPCTRCGSRNLRRSRTKGIYERFRKLHTPARPFRCDDCAWRGWLLPLEQVTPFEAVGDTDLRSLDVTFLLPAAYGKNRAGSDGP